MRQTNVQTRNLLQNNIVNILSDKDMLIHYHFVLSYPNLRYLSPKLWIKLSNIDELLTNLPQNLSVATLYMKILDINTL